MSPRSRSDTSTPVEAAVETLHRLNVEIGEHERLGAGGAPFFEGLLDERLCFRRGDGSTTDRTGFLEALGRPDNVTETLSTTVRQVQVLDDQAFVEAWVHLEGLRAGRRVDGDFRNLRLFERRDGRWRLVMWFNKPLGASGPAVGARPT